MYSLLHVHVHVHEQTSNKASGLFTCSYIHVQCMHLIWSKQHTLTYYTRTRAHMQPPPQHLLCSIVCKEWTSMLGLYCLLSKGNKQCVGRWSLLYYCPPSFKLGTVQARTSPPPLTLHPPFPLFFPLPLLSSFLSYTSRLWEIWENSLKLTVEK